MDQAKALLEKAYAEALAAGDIKEGDTVLLTVGTAVDTESTRRIFDFIKVSLEKLAEELSDIMMDMGQFGDDLFKDDDTMNVELPEEENPYSQKKHIPQYEPTGDFVDIMELIDDEKTNELIKEIKASNVTEDQKNFLIKAAYRHLKFNYSKIADYYSNASEEMQILMEKSALVIIDIDDAIANGYVKLTKVVEGLITKDDGGEDDGE